MGLYKETHHLLFFLDVVLLEERAIWLGRDIMWLTYLRAMRQFVGVVAYVLCFHPLLLCSSVDGVELSQTKTH
ncbi:hypothetical protein EJ110_NYTH04669 [Nymphaea thermarum]|nr:hypothetical protein EJ110_NYTH04669 [Nymphaea thermarum]